MSDATLTILTRCPGVAVMSQVHSLRLGYLSGQLGLLRVPLGLWILCSHSAGRTQKQANAHREEVTIMAAAERVRGNCEEGRRETREPGRISKAHIRVGCEFHLLYTAVSLPSLNSKPNLHFSGPCSCCYMYVQPHICITLLRRQLITQPLCYRHSLDFWDLSQ